MESRFLEIKSIIFIEQDVAGLQELGTTTGVPEYKDRKENVLYVLWLKKGKKNKSLFLSFKWPEEYQKIVISKGKDYDLVPCDDSKELLNCRPGETLDLVTFKTVKKKVEELLGKCCKEMITQAQCEKSCRSSSSSASITTSVPSVILSDPLQSLPVVVGFSSSLVSTTKFSSVSKIPFIDLSDNEESLLIVDISNQEKNNIVAFCNGNSNLVDSVEELSILLQEEDQNSESRQLFTALIRSLKAIPKQKSDQEEAPGNTEPKKIIQDITDAANQLEEELRLNKRWQAWRWVLRILAAIAVAANGVKWGAVAGAAIGGGVASVPAATIGAVGGGLVGGCLGFWGGNWLSHRSSTIAKADHSVAIAKEANKLSSAS